jgi:glycosyltransferase involved in cell wall biosynthesis
LDFFSRSASYSPSNVTNFIMISRVLREKGIIEFIDCYYQLLKTDLIFNFYIVCDRDELVNFCNSHNVSTLFLSTSNFFILPNVGDVRAYLLSSSCLVLPSCCGRILSIFS